MTIYTQSGEFDKEIKSIKELIAFFDNLAEKPLFLNFIGQNVKFWGKDNEEEAAKDEYKYEDLAFSLVENINIEAWNTRFGPINYIKHGDEVIIEKEKATVGFRLEKGHLMNCLKKEHNYVCGENRSLKEGYYQCLHYFPNK